MSEPGDPPGTPEAAGTPGRVLAGRFRVEKVLGRGGMGEVLLAHDTLLHRQVALKLLRTDGGQDSAMRRTAVLKEARRASQVNDRRIAAIYDVLELDDELLIVMEYVEGESLRARLRQPLPLEAFWDLSRQCVEALGAAHEHGVIHRDIKPENLMLTRGNEIKMLDFGIAWRATRDDAPVEGATTATTELHRGPAGTPLYMAPEAHYGGRIDERTDLFSLGAVFYEMLTAQHPFAGDTYEHLLDNIMNTTPKPANEWNPAVTPELAGVVERMLARDPAQRYASCGDVRAALVAAKHGSGGALSSEETFALSRTPLAKRGATLSRTIAVASRAIAVVLAGVLVWRVVAAPRLSAQVILAVLPPATPGATADFAAYALGSVELLSNRLMHHQDRPGFQMASFPESYDARPATAADARRDLGANVSLLSTLEQRENRLRARLELREAHRDRLLGSRLVDVSYTEPFAFADSVYHAAQSLLRLQRREATAQYDVGIRGSGTLRFLLQGIGRRRAATTLESRQHALNDFETAYRTEPDPAAPRAWLAAGQMSLFSTTKDTVWLARAEAAAREAVALDSSRSESHRTLAQALGARKRYAEAEREYRVACTLDPNDDEAWYAWGRMWVRIGDQEEARKVYVAAINRRPHAFKPRWWLASWEYAQGHMPEATMGFREMIRRSPDYFQGYANLGGLLLFQGDYRGAIDTLRIAVDTRPNAGAYSNLGTAYFFSGRLTEAVEAYNQAFQFDDADYRVWMNLGEAYYWLRDRPDQARDAFRQAVRLGRESMASRAQRATSPDPMIPAYLGTILPKLGERDSARTMMRTALLLDSLNSRVQYQTALTQWQLGSHDSALVWLRRAVAGGFPVVWLRDSPVHREWRADPGFQALLVTATSASHPDSPVKGGSR